jgi:hypothetical protein
MIPYFPPAFASLRQLYRGFQPTFEFRRQSFAEWWAHYLRQVDLEAFGVELNSQNNSGTELKTQLMQRHFYRSATSFYRSFDLFLSYLSLQHHKFGTWAEVTGYYSRFYFIQAFLNLLQASWFGAEDSIPTRGLLNQRDKRFFAYNTGDRAVFLPEADLRHALGTSRQGSHSIWWAIFGCLGEMADYPQLESLSFVLGDGYFNVSQRNEVNYSHEYIRGFPELEWFDSSTDSMRTHFDCQLHRPDRDITNIDRFFQDDDPENVDTADFYSDGAQMLWCSTDCYLRVLRSLEIRQDFITLEKLEMLTREHIGRDLPRLVEGITTGIRESLEIETSAP